eukprot:maker-scaffold_11-snap-gene-8.42-mRNA-1 protein AED:0.05 eAED:0.07 QI:0/0/0.5/1/1/1/2/187/407
MKKLAVRIKCWKEKFLERISLTEVSGSLGDLGTFLPLFLAMQRVGAIRAGLLNVVTGMTFDSPMPVQPMKAIAAAAITEKLSAAEVSGAGLGVAAVILLLGTTGMIELVNKVVPISVVKGLQLGLGLSMLKTSFDGFSLESGRSLGLSIGAAIFVLIFFNEDRIKVPTAIILTIIGLTLGFFQNEYKNSSSAVNVTSFVEENEVLVFLPLEKGGLELGEMVSGFIKAGLAQIPLTTLNSVISVGELHQELFPLKTDQRIIRRKIATSVGFMNLVGICFGSMPVCHGAGGLAAQYAFGARSGVSVIFLGFLKMLSSFVISVSLLEQFPSNILNVLLAFAGITLAVSGLNHPPDDEKKQEHLLIMLITASATLALKTGLGFSIGFVSYVFLYVKKNCINSYQIRQREVL